MSNSDQKDTIKIDDALSIPLSELSFRFSRSGGPGGQHVNRSETRVELLFDVSNSPSFSEEQREQLLARLDHRIDKDGVLHLVSEESRSQRKNRETVIERFGSLLQTALRPRRKRRPTRPSHAARQRRLEEKRRQSRKKQTRQRPEID
ncbi:MAG: aminoacyl-tRNA hydrolase [Anaerolineales bacterium]|nr:aminoacyl-tRNA hydrolase [Anaerolineales bacterium]